VIKIETFFVPVGVLVWRFDKSRELDVEKFQVIEQALLRQIDGAGILEP